MVWCTNGCGVKFQRGDRNRRAAVAQIVTSKYARLYASLAGGFLLLQGVSTLAAQLFPRIDRALPQLLEFTQMVKSHSILHIISGLLAMAMLRRGDPWSLSLFAAGFGAFYGGLGALGIVARQPSALHMQSFDHPFHLLLGGLGLAAVVADRLGSREKALQ